MSPPKDNYQIAVSIPIMDIERLERKLLLLGLISYSRLVGSCSKMPLDGSIMVEICDETMRKCGANQSNCGVSLPAC